MFWTKFAQKGDFRLKTETVNITIEFCIIELVTIFNFSLANFRPNLPNRYTYIWYIVLYKLKDQQNK